MRIRKTGKVLRNKEEFEAKLLDRWKGKHVMRREVMQIERKNKRREVNRRLVEYRRNM